MKTTVTKLLLAVLGLACVSSLKAALPDPMVWFDMKEVTGSVVSDASGNGHDLTLGPTVQIVDDVAFGKILVATGKTSDYATFSCPVVTNTTIAFWIRRNAADSSIIVDGAEKNTMPYIMTSGYSGFGINYAWRNSLPIMMINQQNNPQTSFEGASPKRDEWHHVAFTVDYAEGGDYGTLTYRCYLDGVKVKQDSQANNRPMRLPGKQDVILFNVNKDGLRPTSGAYADIRFYDKSLDADQIKQLVSDVLGKRLVMRYAFDEISEDVDGNGRHSTPESTGMSSKMTLGKNMTLVDDGIDGKALRFMDTTEIGGQVTAPAAPIIERTFSAWVRSSSRRTEMDAKADNPYPRFIHGFCRSGTGGYSTFSDSAGYSRAFVFQPAGSTAAKTVSDYGVAEFDTWSHLTLVERFDENGKGVADLYVNGEAVDCEIHDPYDLEVLQGPVTFFVGNNGEFASTRYFCGDLDEFRLYNYALSADEVRRLYRGLAKIDAGEDFTIAGSKGILHGVVKANAGDGYRKGYAGQVSWTLVSGDGATILQPESAETEVVLPGPGTYVFRLSIADLGETKCDEVTVTCVAADDGNQAPTVSLDASAQAITLPDFVLLTATVTDDNRPEPAKTRVSWMKKSGPGGVWFEPDGVTAKACFGEAGTYVLTCVADDGQATSCADVTVAVADRADGKELSSDLLHYFSLDGQCLPYFTDQGSITPKSDLTVPDYDKLRYVPGKVANGARAFAYVGKGSYWTTGAALGEVGVDPSGTYGGLNLPPQNDYLTISAWIYIDPDDVNLANGDVVGASVVGQGYSFGLRYNEKWLPGEPINVGGFSLYQQGRTIGTEGDYVDMSMAHYPVPSPSPVGRWMHICAILARNAADCGLWEMWYDGVKQAASKSTGACRGRVTSNGLNIGGMDAVKTDARWSDYNANWAKPGKSASEDPADFYTRTFPGVVDEVRIWTRKLTPGEIRYLAANPILDENKGPSVDAPTSSPQELMTKKTAQIYTAAFADKLPDGGALTYRWSVLSGDASLVTIADPSAHATTFIAKKAGLYVLQLKVSDGERTVCSRPLKIKVTAPGLAISIR